MLHFNPSATAWAKVCSHMLQVLSEMTSYAELHKGLQDGSLPIVEDRSGLVYNPLSLIEVSHL